MEVLMKKIITVLCSLLLMFSMSACATEEVPTPTAVTEAFLHAYQDYNNTGIHQNSLWDSFDANTLTIQKKDYVQGVDESLQQEVYKKMNTFSFKVEKESIKEESAEVAVTLSLYDFEPVAKQGMENATKKTDELIKKSKVSDAEIQTEIMNVLFKSLNEAKPNKTMNVTVFLTLKDGNWLVSDTNDDLRHALTSNSNIIDDLA